MVGSAFWGTTLTITAPAVSLLFLLLTTALLVLDLKRPERFAYILFKPNWRSWLVWGAWILIAFSAAAGAWLGAGLLGHHVPDAVRLPVGLLALGAAGYSALLFGQAEGRDFWQSPLVLPHLVVAALAAGSATLLLASFAVETRAPARYVFHPSDALGPLMVVSLIANAVLLAIELGSHHPVRDVAKAAMLVTRGGYRRHFWLGVVLAGALPPLPPLGAGLRPPPPALWPPAALLPPVRALPL